MEVTDAMMDDGNIINLFFERSERAIIELANKYGPVCFTVSINILNDRLEAEECVNDSYLAVWNNIPPQRPNPLLSFVCRIVRNISINRYKKNSAQKRKGNYELCLDEIENIVSNHSSVEDECSVAELTALIDEFLDSQAKTNRMIFVRRFWYLDSYKDIADASGLREGAVRTRLSRVKSDLRKFLERNGVII